MKQNILIALFLTLIVLAAIPACKALYDFKIELHKSVEQKDSEKEELYQAEIDKKADLFGCRVFYIHPKGVEGIGVVQCPVE